MNLARGAFGLATGLVSGIGKGLITDPILKAGEKDGKSFFATTLEAIAKRGEGDIPKPFQTLLKAYTGTINITSTGLGLLIGLGLSPVIIGEWIESYTKYRVKLKKAKDDKDEENAEADAKRQEILTRITNGLDSLTDLTDSQRDAILNMLDFDTSTPALLATNGPLNDILRDENLYGWLHASRQELDNPGRLKEKLDLRAKITDHYTKTYLDFSHPIISGVRTADTTKFPVVQARIANLDKVLNAKGKVGSLDAGDRKLLEDLKIPINGDIIDETKAEEIEAYQFLRKDIQFLADRIKANNDISVHIGMLERVKEVVTKLDKSKLLGKYKEASLLGVASEIVPINDALAFGDSIPDNLRSEFIELGFVYGSEPFNPVILSRNLTIPTIAEATAQEAKLSSTISTLPSPKNFAKVSGDVKKKFRGNPENLRLVSSQLLKFLPNEIVMISDISRMISEVNKPPLTFPGTPIVLRFNGVNVQITTQAELDAIKLIFDRDAQRKAGTINVNTIGKMSNDLLAAIPTVNPTIIAMLNSLKTFSKSNEDMEWFIFGGREGASATNIGEASVIDFIRCFTDNTKIGFEVIYQGFNGKLNDLASTIDVSKSNDENGRNLFNSIYSTFRTMQIALNQLKLVLADKDKAERLAKAHAAQIDAFSRGEIVSSQDRIKQTQGEALKTIPELLSGIIRSKDPIIVTFATVISGSPYNINLEKLDPQQTGHFYGTRLLKPFKEEELVGRTSTAEYLRDLLNLKRAIVAIRTKVTAAYGTSPGAYPQQIQDTLATFDYIDGMLQALGIVEDRTKIPPEYKYQEKQALMFLNGLRIGPILDGKRRTLAGVLNTSGIGYNMTGKQRIA